MSTPRYTSPPTDDKSVCVSPVLGVVFCKHPYSKMPCKSLIVGSSQKDHPTSLLSNARKLLGDREESSDITMKVKREDGERDMQASDEEAEVGDSSQDSQATEEEVAVAEESGQEELSPTRSEADSSWRESKQFLLRLSCMTEEGVPLPFRDELKKHLTVSRDYTICGFQNKERGALSMILVNKLDTALSLEPDTMGEVLGISSSGLAIPGKGKEHHRKFMEKHVLPQRLRDRTVFHKDGMVTDSIQPRLREYIKEERRKLFLPGKPTLIPVAHAYAMAQDYFHKKMFNWAQHRAEYIRRRLVRGALPLTAKDLLCHYISIALPSVMRTSEGVHSSAFLDGLEPKIQAGEATTSNWETEFVEVGQEVKCEESQRAADTSHRAAKNLLRKFVDSPVPLAKKTSEIVTSCGGLEAVERKKAKLQVVETGLSQEMQGRVQAEDFENHHEPQPGRVLEPLTRKPSSLLTQGLKRKQGDYEPDEEPDNDSTELDDQVTLMGHSLETVRNRLQEMHGAMRSKLEAKDDQIRVKQAENTELFRQLTACESRVRVLEKIVDGYAEWRRASKECAEVSIA